MKGEQYVILLVDVPGHPRYVHSLHPTEESADAEIERVKDAPFVMADLEWTKEVRRASEIFALAKQLNALRPRVAVQR